MPQAHIRANEVLDNGSLAFENDDTAPWIAGTADFHRGGCSLRSGAIPDDGQTAVSVVLEGSGTLTFWWKVSSNGAPSVTITGLPEGAAVAIRFGESGIPIPAAAFVGFGDKAEGVFSLALNPEGVVNGVKVQPAKGAWR